MFHGLRKGQDSSVCLPSKRGGATAAVGGKKRENDRQERHKTKKIRKDGTRRVPVEGWRERTEERKEEKGTARSQEGGGGRWRRWGATAGCFGLSDG